MFRPRTSARGFPALASSLAIATALAAAPQARAQSFDATSTLLAGNATVTTGTGTTTITVASPTAVLQWTPNDTGTTGTINFQATGTTATFQGTATAGNFAVLNNIVPTTTSRPIQFNGNVISQLQNATGGTSPGGTVFFYSPGGIIVGSTAVIDVGNLGLTTSPVAYNGTTGEFRTPDPLTGSPQVKFGAANPGSFVTVQSGAGIFAGYQNGNPFADGSYVAIVAPRINVGGAIHVNGSAALVAADAATVTFSPDGLFSIAVDTPTSATGNVLSVDPGGVITGPAASSTGTHGIYLVTAPRNTLLTMAVSSGSSLGFDIAGAADVIGNRVVLSGGFNVGGGAIDETTVVGTGGKVDIIMDNATATSQVNVSATGQAVVQATNASSPTSLAAGLSLHSLTNAFLSASTGAALTIAGDVDVRAIDPGTLTGASGNLTGGNARIFAQGAGSQINLNGASVSVRADVSAPSVTAAGGVGGNATGGFADVTANTGGTVLIAGDLSLSADGRGAIVATTGGSAGNGTGGRADIDAFFGNATVSVAGGTFISAQGIGGDCVDATCVTGGGSGTGGTVFISSRALNATGSSGSSVNLVGSTSLDASGSGGAGMVMGGGLGQGGSASLFADNGNLISIQSGMFVSASGRGGDILGAGLKGGNGIGGTASITALSSAQIQFSGQFAYLYGDAGGIGGSVQFGRTGAIDGFGGDGSGGSVTVSVSGATISGATDISIGADGEGGSEFNGTSTGAGGLGQGGHAFVGVSKGASGNGGTLSAGNLYLYSGGFGGGGVNAGNAVGGNSGVSVSGASSLQISNFLQVNSEATGGVGLGDPALFRATGGTASLDVQSGGQAIISGGAGFYANADGGSLGEGSPNTDGNGGSAKGGNVFISLSNSNAVVDIAGSLDAHADGRGSTGFCAAACLNDAGMGRGGVVSINVTAGTNTPGGGSSLSIGSNTSSGTFLSAEGIGGFGIYSNGGAGTGGNVNLSVSDATGSASPNSINLFSLMNISAYGGGGDQGGTATTTQPLAGGVGTGGSVFVGIPAGGILNAAGSFLIGAPGRGGNGNNDTGGFGASGGAAVGGIVSLVNNGGTATFQANVSLDADAVGGTAYTPDATGIGGAATGGTAEIRSANSNPTAPGLIGFAGTVFATAGAQGGDGLNGGDAIGGDALMLTMNGTITGTSVNLYAGGAGGNGQNSFINATDGYQAGNGGTGTGGTSQVLARTGQDSGNRPGVIAIDSVQLNAGGFGGAGGDAFSFDFAVNGGNGGNGIAGQALALASAGSGQLSVTDTVQAFALGSGGRGGNGSDSPSGDGGNGGFGGIGTGGNSNIGTQSGILTTVNTGSAQFGSVVSTMSGFGGNGGNGGTPISSTGSFLVGLGGAGGAAFDGGASLLVRGSTVTITGGPSGTGGVNLTADAIGGTGGTGRVQGIGGDATIGGTPTTGGGVGVLVTNRFQVPTQGGTLNATHILAQAEAIGGAGSTVGSSIIGDQPLLFQAVNSTISANDISLFATGQTVQANALESPVLLTNSTVNISNSFSFNSNGPIAVSLDNSTMNVLNLFLRGSDWVLPATTVPQPAVIGTINITNAPGSGVQFRTNNNILAYANFNFPFDVTFNLVGSLRFDNISGGNAFVATTGGSIQLGSTDVSDLSLSAGTDINLGAINASGDVSLDSGGNITTGPISAGIGVFANALGNVLVSGNTSAGTDVNLLAGGSLTAGDIQSGLARNTSSTGTFEIGLQSAGPLSVGNLNAVQYVVVASDSTLTTGNISSGADVLVLGHGDITTGSINASGSTLFADSSAAAAGGTIGFGFNPGAVFTSRVAPTAGSITINGPVFSFIGFDARAGTTFTSGNIATSSGGITITSAGSQTVGSLNAFGFVNLSAASGTITATGLTTRAADIVVQSTGGASASLGNITSANGVTVFGLGNIDLGSITAGTAIFLRGTTGISATGAISGGTSVTAISGGGLFVQNVTGGTAQGSFPSGNFDVSLQAATQLVSGALVSPRLVLATAGGTVSTGGITARDALILSGSNATVGGQVNATGRVLFANSSMTSLGGSVGPSYNSSLVFNAVPVQAGGAVSTSGPVTAGTSFTAATQGTFSAPAITVTNGLLMIDAGGAVSTGNLSSSTTQNIVVHSKQDISVGAISSADALLLGGGSITTGPIAVQFRALLANESLFALGQSGGGFNVTPVFNAVPDAPSIVNNRVAGGIAINGGVSGTVLKAASTLDLSVMGPVAETADIALNSGGNITTVALTAGGSIDVRAGGNATTGDLDVAHLLPTAFPNEPQTAYVQAGGNIVTGNINALNLIALFGNQNLTTGSLVTTDVLALVHGSQSLGTITASGRVLLADNSNASIGISPTAPFGYDPNLVFAAVPARSLGPITTRAVTAAGLFSVATQGAFSATSVAVSNGPLTVDAGGAVSTGNLSALQNLTVFSDNGGITVSNLSSNASIDVRALTSGDVQAGNIFASSAAQVRAAGNVTAGGINAVNGPIIGFSGGNFVSGGLIAGGFLNINSGGSLDVGSVQARDSSVLAAGLTTPARLKVAGTVTAADIFLLSRGSLVTGNLTATAATSPSAVGTYQVIVQADDSVLTGNVAADDLVVMRAGRSIDTASISSGAGVGLFSAGSIFTGPITASGNVIFADEAMFAIGDLNNGYDLDLVFNSPTLTGSGTYGISGGSVLAAGFKASTTGSVFTGDVIANSIIDVLGANGISMDNIDSAGPITLSSSGDITTGNIGQSLAPALLLVTGGGAVTTGAIGVSGSASLFGATSLTTGDIFATADLSLGSNGVLTAGQLDVGSLFASADTVSIGNIISADYIDVSGSTVTLASIDAVNDASVDGGLVTISGGVTTGSTFDVQAFSDITVAGTIQSGADVTARAGGLINVGDVSSGTVTRSTATGATFNIGLAAGGALSVGNLSAVDDIGLLAGTGIDASSLSATEVLVLGHSDIVTGAITAPGRVLVADSSMAALGGTIGANFDPNPVFMAAPVRTAGAITLAGPVQARAIQAYAGTDIVAGNVMAQFVAVLNAGNGLSMGNLDAGTIAAAIAQTGSLTVGNVSAGTTIAAPAAPDGHFVLLTAGGALNAGNVASAEDISIVGRGGTMTLGALSAPKISVLGSGDIAIQSISSTGRVRIDDASLRSLITFTNGSINLQPVFDADPVRTAGAIAIASPVRALTFQAAAGTAFTAPTITSTSDVQIDAGSVAVNGIDGGANVLVKADGAITVGNVTSGTVLLSTDPNDDQNIALIGGTVRAGNLSALDDIGLAATGTINVGNLSANEMLILGHGNIATGAIAAQGRVLVADQSMLAIGGTIGNNNGNYDPNLVFAAAPVRTAGTVTIDGRSTANGNAITGSGLTIASGGDVTILGNLFGTGSALIDSAAGVAQSAGVIGLPLGSLTIAANGPVTTQQITVGGQNGAPGAIAIDTTGSITTGQLGATTTISVDGRGAVSTGSIFTGGNVDVVGGPSVTTGNVTSQNGAVTLSSGGALTTGLLSAGTTLTLATQGVFNVGQLAAGSNIGITGTNLNLTQAITSSGQLTIAASGSLQTSAITAAGAILLTSGTSLSSGTNAIQSTGGSVTVRAGTTLALGPISAGGAVSLNSTGATQLASINANGAVTAVSGSTLSSGQISSNISVIASAAGNLTLSNVFVNNGPGQIELSSSSGSISANLLRTAGDIAAIANQSLALNFVQGRDMVLLAGQSAQIGSINAGVTSPASQPVTSATGRVLIANASQGALGGKFGSYDFNAVLQGTPVLAAGTVTVNGTVNAGQFLSYSVGNMTAQAINAFGSLEVQSGGLVTVGQRWTSPDQTITSNDIDIQPSRAIQPTPGNPNPGNTLAGLNAGKSGDIVLLSTNTNGQFVGDGLTTGNGYALSGAEFALINSGSLLIGAQDVAANPIDMTVGNLAITGPQAGSTIDDPNGTVTFVTGDVATETPGLGGIKIIGAITAKGLLSTNTIQFITGALELDVTKGSIAVTDSAGALAGNISIEADHIHFAEQSILDKLRADPFYAGHVQDLNTPPVNPPTGPVISAATLDFAPTQTLYIQNTGTQPVPAGFLAPTGGLAIDVPAQSTQNEPVAITINGQFSNGGTAPNTTGQAAFSQFVAQDRLSNITTDSQFNTCMLAVGSCSSLGDKPAEPDISNTIQVITADTLPEQPFAADPQDEEQKDTSTKEEQAEEKAEAAAKSPIAPPAPLVDTRPLNPAVTVDEPVAGSGNPALIDSGRPNQGGNQ